MKPRKILATAVAFALPAWTLCAQDNPAPRPPDAPQRDGGPRREAGPRPEGLASGQRPTAGLFGALDANHDGTIDAEELNRAADALRKLDRNGDGKLGPDDFRPTGDGQPRRPEGGEAPRPQGDSARPPNPETGPRPDQPQRDGNRPARPDGKHRGPDLRAEPRGEQRPEQPRGEGQRWRQPETRAPQGPQPEGDRPHREGPGAPPAGDPGPQAQHRYHHHPHGFGRPDGRSRFTQRGPFPGGQNRGPSFAQRGPQSWGGDRPGPRPPWEGWKPRVDGSQQGRFAMGPRMDGFRNPWAAPQPPGEYRRDARGPAPQNEWSQGFRPPQDGWGGQRFDSQRGNPQPGGQQFGPGMRRFDQGDVNQRPSWSGPRRGFGPPPPNLQGREQGPERPPMPPAPQGPEDPRFHHHHRSGPPPQGAENERPDGPAPV